MPDLEVNTFGLNQYAQRLGNVNRRITNLDWRLKSLYGQVGLLDLWNLIRADALTGYSVRILMCQSYLTQTASDFDAVENKLLSQDPTDFSKPPVSGIKEVIYDVGVGIKKGAEKVKSVVEKTITSAFDSYYSHGTVYKVVQYGKAALKAAKGVGKIVAGVGSLIGSGGLSTPVSILAIISGANDVYNAIMDGTYTYTEEYDKVGKTNFLKDKLAENGSIIGGYFGNEKAGEIFGKVTYYGVDLVTSLATLELSLDKIKQLDPTNFGAMGAELKEIGNLDVSHIFTTDVEALRYEVKLASYMFSETANFISNASALYGVAENSVKVGKSIDSIITVNSSEDWSNPVIELFDKVSDIKDKVGKGISYTSKATKLVFG